ARLERRWAIGNLPPLFGVEEVEGHDVEAARRQRLREADDEPALLTGAGAVREDERGADRAANGRVDERRGGARLDGDGESIQACPVPLGLRRRSSGRWSPTARRTASRAIAPACGRRCSARRRSASPGRAPRRCGSAGWA